MSILEHQNGESIIPDRKDAIEYLQQIIGLPVLCAWKIPVYCDLYEFGFGNWTSYDEQAKSTKIRLYSFERWFQIRAPLRRSKKDLGASHVIHTLCPITVSWKQGSRPKEIFDEDTDHLQFHEKTRGIIGLIVEDIQINNNNDLEIDLGECKILLKTKKGHQSKKESWRFYTSNVSEPHLVVAKKWMSLG